MKRGIVPRRLDGGAAIDDVAFVTRLQPVPMQSTRAFTTLDALRGIAAMAVISWHGGLLFGDRSTFMAAFLAVDLFFILSGFVLAHAYEARLQTGLSAASFLRLRLIRLYPLYLLGFLVAGGALALRLHTEMREGSIELALAAALNAIMLPNPPTGSPPFLFLMNFPAWSLFFELVANILFAAFGARLTLRGTAVFVGIAGVALIAVTVRNHSFDMGATWQTFDGGLARAVFGFFAGVLLYRLRERFAFTAQHRSTAMVCVLALVTVVTFLPRIAIDGARPSPGLLLFVAMAVYPALILLAARYEPGPRLAPICAWLGVASYAAYVLHVPLHSLGGIVSYLAAGSYLEAYAPFSGLAYLGLIGVCAWATDKFWDRPIRAFLGRRLPHVGGDSAAVKAKA